MTAKITPQEEIIPILIMMGWKFTEVNIYKNEELYLSFQENGFAFLYNKEIYGDDFVEIQNEDIIKHLAKPGE